MILKTTLEKYMRWIGRLNVSIDDRFELVDNRDKDRFEVNQLKKKK